MDHNAKLVQGTEYWKFVYSHTPVDLDNKYIGKINNFISEFGYDKSYIKTRKTSGHWSDSSEDSVVILDMTYGTKDSVNGNLKLVSFELHEYDDDWFILKFWSSYGTGGERVDTYLCDQFDSVIYQLGECFKIFPKENDVVWNRNIEKEFNRQRKELLKKALEMTRKHIMSFTKFQELDYYRNEKM